MQSIWSDKTPQFKNIGNRKKLENDIQTDVLIIGGGVAGILCAYALCENGVKCVVLEGGKIASGTTALTTAKITLQHGVIYSRLLEKFGYEYARGYYLANKRALETYQQMCSGIDCDFEQKYAYLFSCEKNNIIEKEERACKEIGCNAQIVRSLDIPIGCEAVRIENQAQFNPLKFVNFVCKNIEIYENSFVRKIKGCRAFTDSGSVEAKKIIFCTHFPIVNTRGSYSLKLYQSRSYLLALENAANVGGMYIEAKNGGFSFRNYGNLLLLGGGGHKCGEVGGGYEVLEKFADKTYPQAKITSRWAAQDCMSLDGIPYIGHYSANSPNWYVATGFGKWGMTSSMIAAQNITDLILRRKNPYLEIFSPSRSVLNKQFFTNVGSAAKNLVRFKKMRCSHLGCALNWNSQEGTWDCPCHGSRFDRKGRILNNPAIKDIDIK